MVDEGARGCYEKAGMVALHKAIVVGFLCEKLVRSVVRRLARLQAGFGHPDDERGTYVAKESADYDPTRAPFHSDAFFQANMWVVCAR
ncbi:hypothetical protein EBH_0029260 [Eimeria brunetti]|uniref:Uncharacterized protein n=1 Tax=Eimeria brunetti TaxID=51314 RepID=U6LKT4_9EIME|nr:hypothetical protein EBH_0029260 [Eimeria brunetti]